MDYFIVAISFDLRKFYFQKVYVWQALFEILKTVYEGNPIIVIDKGVPIHKHLAAVLFIEETDEDDSNLSVLRRQHAGISGLYV